MIHRLPLQCKGQPELMDPIGVLGRAMFGSGNVTNSLLSQKLGNLLLSPCIRQCAKRTDRPRLMCHAWWWASPEYIYVEDR